MSLGSLARYDDAEDEIRDEDHNLVLEAKKSTQQQQQLAAAMDMEAKPSPSTSVESLPAKPKMTLVADYDMSDDDDMSESDPDETEEEPKIEVVNEGQNKESVVNLGLFNRASVLPSGESETPNLNDSFVEASPRPDSIQLPPEPEGRCSKQLQEKIAAMLKKKQRDGLNLNEYIEMKKDFRNPSIYEKLISFIGIDEHGTNFPRKLYDPSIWGPDSHYDELARKQKEYAKEKEKERLQKQRTQVDFVTGTKKPAVSAAPSSTSSEKKSKWDQKVAPPPKGAGGGAKIVPKV